MGLVSGTERRSRSELTQGVLLCLLFGFAVVNFADMQRLQVEVKQLQACANSSFSNAPSPSSTPAFEDSQAHARTVPIFTNGRFVGIRVFNIKDASPCKALGLKDLDIVTAISGLPVTAKTTLADICESGQSTKLTLMTDGATR